MSYLIKDFEKIESEEFISLADGGIGKLPNQDVYRKPVSNGIIDVVNRFSWFSSGTTSSLTEAAISRIPAVRLKEYDQILSSQLSQALYYLNASIKGGEKLVDTATGESSPLSKFAEYLGLSKKTVDTGEAIVKPVIEQINKFKKLLEKKSASPAEVKRLSDNYLSALVGIYLTEPTGFEYSLPYFEKPPVIQNTWSQPENTGMVGDLINTGMKIVEEVASFVNITQPGIYIQKAKSYSFTEEGPTITIQFPLFNTVRRGKDTPYQLNYELLWLLAYQNKPYKTAFARAKPPKIYEVTIPGLVNMPYAQIRNLTVDFVGTVRNKQVTIAGIGNLTVPVPDAYNVTIEIESLLSDYANLMVGSGFGVTQIDNTITIQNPQAPPRVSGNSGPTAGSNAAVATAAGTGGGGPSDAAAAAAAEASSSFGKEYIRDNTEAAGSFKPKTIPSTLRVPGIEPVNAIDNASSLTNPSPITDDDFGGPLTFP